MFSSSKIKIFIVSTVNGVTQSPGMTLQGIESGATLTNGYRTSDTRISIGTLLTLGPSNGIPKIVMDYQSLTNPFKPE